MSAFFAALKDLVPFGIIGLAIAAVLIIVLNPKSAKIQLFAVFGIVVIAVLAGFDKIWQPGKLDIPSTPVAAPVMPPGTTTLYVWIDTGANADWGGRDRAFTSTSVPKYMAGNASLCDENRSGTLATCWENRSGGYPPGNVPTDIDRANPTSQWCTYKDSTINIATPPDGAAPKGRVYICGRAIARPK